LEAVPRPSQADSAAFADDYAYGNESRVAGYADDAGQRGLPLELSPHDLSQLTTATTAILTAG
jgi:prolyl-tRNA editing enzyme YbaK/EbsC (Cys-tRNA(Pro) deacylase)